jgi:hypothetical protein
MSAYGTKRTYISMATMSPAWFSWPSLSSIVAPEFAVIVALSPGTNFRSRR